MIKVMIDVRNKGITESSEDSIESELSSIKENIFKAYNEVTTSICDSVRKRGHHNNVVNYSGKRSRFYR